MTSNCLFSKNPVLRKVTPAETMFLYILYVYSLLFSSMYKSMKAGPTLVVLKLLRASGISFSVAAIQ